MVAEAAVTAAENFGSKPASFIALISTWPMPAASPTAVPDMPEKIRLPTTLTCARPPVKWPTSACAKRKMRSVMPPVFISEPARMKKGIASSVKPDEAANMRCAIIVRDCASPAKM